MRLQQIRESRGLSRKALAEILSVSEATYSAYGKGKRRIPLRIVIKLVDYYEISCDYLVGLTDEPKPKNDNKAIQLRRNGLRRSCMAFKCLVNGRVSYSDLCMMWISSGKILSETCSPSLCATVLCTSHSNACPSRRIS